MTDVSNHLYETIDRQNSHETAATRRQLIKGTTAALAGAGILGLATGTDPASAKVATADANSAQNILNVAAAAEVLATIVNTVGPEKLGNRLDAVTKRNIMAAAQQEKNHYETLVSVGGKSPTKTIYVPDEVFASPENLLKTLIVGDQVFVNAYLLGLTVFARQGTLSGSKFARYAGEIMAVESVHRAVALQSLGMLGNDRAYAKFAQREETPGIATTGAAGFYKIGDAVTVLESAGFGFGKAGSKPGQAYSYDEVSARTPKDPSVNTLNVS